MSEPNVLLLPGRVSPSWTPRQLITILFRRKRAIAVTFLAVFIPVLLAVALLPNDYAAETKILIERRRFDPVITSTTQHEGAGADQSQLGRLDEQDIDSEIDLLTSNDVLQEVVMRCNLWNEVPRWRAMLPIPLGSQEKRVAKAVARMRKDMHVVPPNKSNVVTVSYESHNPAKAAEVLRVLSQVYMDKHLEVHRPPGDTKFFNDEVERNRQSLATAEAKLDEFTKKNSVVAADAEGHSMLDRMSAFDATLHNTQAQIESTEKRIATLRVQLKSAKPRVITQVKTSSTLLENLKSTLASLELKRSEMLTKYQPTYRPVQDLDQQIAEARTAIANAEKAPSAEQTTDQDPAYVWLNSELVKAMSELSGLRATEAETKRTLAEYRSRSVDLQALATQQADLTRNVKAAEEVYMESVRKQNEAHLSEALDRAQITNVAVAEAAAIPAIPVMSAGLKLGLGFAMALFLGLGVAFAMDYLDPSFRTPLEVESMLDIPVLVAIPESRLRSHITNSRPPYPLAG